MPFLGQLVGARGVLEREHFLQIDGEAAGVDHLPKLLELLPVRPHEHVRRCDSARAEVVVRRRLRDRDDAPVIADRVDGARERLAADRVEDDVDAVRNELAYGLDDITDCVVDHLVSAEAEDVIAVALARDADHLGAGIERELDGEAADAARGRVDENCLAGRQSGTEEERLIGRQRRERDRRGVLEVQ